MHNMKYDYSLPPITLAYDRPGSINHKLKFIKQHEKGYLKKSANLW